MSLPFPHPAAGSKILFIRDGRQTEGTVKASIDDCHRVVYLNRGSDGVLAPAEATVHDEAVIAVWPLECPPLPKES